MKSRNALGLISSLLGLAFIAGLRLSAPGQSPARGYSIPIIDLSGDTQRQVVVDKEQGQYLGHPTTVLLEDGKTIIAGYPKGHGRGAIVMKRSSDGGLTWGSPTPVLAHPEAHLCEPGIIRSPDGKQLAMLLRENSRQFNSFVSFSDDEGQIWSEPREVPGALTGDRHVGRYAPDGRLFITFRDTTRLSPTKGDWVGWVGTYEDIVKGQAGQYRVRLMDNKKDADCAYPGLELLPDGTFVTTTYGHWRAGEPPFIISVRFKMVELEAREKTR
jgi:hypothetical protein